MHTKGMRSFNPSGIAFPASTLFTAARIGQQIATVA